FAHAVSGSEANQIQRENASPPSRGFMGPANTDGAVGVYVSATDARPGEGLAVHVSTSPAAAYRVLVYRLGWYDGAGARLMDCLPGCSTQKAGLPHAVPQLKPADGYLDAGW